VRALALSSAGAGGHIPAWRQSDGTQVWSAQTDGNVEAVALLDGALYVGGHLNNYCDGGGYHDDACDAPVIRHHLLGITSLATDGIDSVWNPTLTASLASTHWEAKEPAWVHISVWAATSKTSTETCKNASHSSPSPIPSSGRNSLG
jgi:hypothetical protein